VLFTNVRSINGVGLPATATVLTARTQDVHTYQVGSPNAMQIADLDGQPGSEVLFTNVRSINGVGLPATATVLTIRTQDVHSYQVGSPNAMQIADLDGQPGSEVLFTNVRSINGVGLPATATVLTIRTQDVHSYQVGSPMRCRSQI